MNTEENALNKKPSLLAQWKKRKGKEKQAVSIDRLPAGIPAPLSFGQRRLWFLQQRYPNNPFYHFADAYQIKGSLDIELLFKSMEVVVERQEILRTVIELNGSHAFQKINSEINIETAHIDLSQYPQEKREEEIDRLVNSTIEKPFDLKNGPLMRMYHIQCASEESLILVAVHHIIMDQWSMQLLWEELSEVYRSSINGIAHNLLPLTYQYADFAYWETEKKIEAASLAYWKKKLSGELPVLNLPTDRPLPITPSFEGTFHRQLLSRELTQQLKGLAKEADTTTFVLLLAAFKMFLHRYSGQEDILVGTPVSNRNHTAFEKLIGFFLETIVLRSDFSNDPTGLSFINQVKTTTLEAFAHKKIPFEKLVKELGVQRHSGISPLFQTMFVYHDAAYVPSFGVGIDVLPYHLDMTSAKFDLTLHVAEKEGQLSVIFEYATDLFDELTVERMQTNFQTLLESLIENPKEKVAALDVLPKSSAKKILNDWNAHKIDLPDIPYIHFWIEQQAEQHPDQVAIVFQNEKLTYDRLNRRATSIAKHLIGLGTQPNAPIGLHTERSLEMIVGILGILKAGGAYLPLDPQYPLDRIRFMVEDAGGAIVLTNQGYIEGVDNEVVKVVDIHEIPILQSDNFIQPSINKEDTAYIIYTSGSTGKPKGVAVSHSNLIHSTFARFEYYPQSPDAFLLLSSFAFDSSIAGIFWTLCSGGTLVVAKYRIEQDVEELADLIEHNKVSHTLLLPSLYTMILQNIEVQRLRSLHSVIVAGEACTSSLCQLHFSKLSDTVHLYNEYGPTEASVWCTVYQLTKNDTTGRIPIGQPIPNAEAYVLDKNLQPLPIGVSGDLYIGGAGITDGYLNRPELTKERFIDHPFKQELKEKLYKTGDLASYRPNGQIDFLGRGDHQVKIRGFRIELEEIRAVIKQQKEVEEAYVFIQEESLVIDENLESAENEASNLIATLDESEADKLLTSIEALSEETITLMLREIGN